MLCFGPRIRFHKREVPSPSIVPMDSTTTPFSCIGWLPLIRCPVRFQQYACFIGEV